jgi:hypothetical protein
MSDPDTLQSALQGCFKVEHVGADESFPVGEYSFTAGQCRFRWGHIKAGRQRVSGIVSGTYRVTGGEIVASMTAVKGAGPRTHVDRIPIAALDADAIRTMTRQPVQVRHQANGRDAGLLTYLVTRVSSPVFDEQA